MLQSRSRWLVVFAVALIVMLTTSVFTAAAASGTEKPAQQTTWNLVWQDNFDGSSVNTSNWTFEQGGHGWGNNELQYYTNGQNASVSGGILTITANRVTGGYSCWYGTCQYTSTRMNTAGKRTFQYGRIEARMALPTGQGIWPAFWSLGANFPSVGWPRSGEIDFMEHVNLETRTHGTIHWDNNGYVYYGGPSGFVDVTQYHVYAVEWDANAIRWYVDGVKFWEANIQNGINGTDEFHRPFFLILNLAVGGNWPGSPNAQTVFPARMMVDYVRVYQQGTPPPPPPPSGIVNGAYYDLVNQTSGKCVDARSSATANGTAVQQYTCNNSFAQHWQFVATSSGYYRLNSRNNTNQVIDVSGVSAADNALIHLWGYGGGNNQQWLPQSLGNGYYRFVSRHSGKCLDVPAASTANSVQLVQYTCNGTGAQSFLLRQK